MDQCHWPYQEKQIDSKKVFNDLLVYHNEKEVIYSTQGSKSQIAQDNHSLSNFESFVMLPVIKNNYRNSQKKLNYNNRHMTNPKHHGIQSTTASKSHAAGNID